MTKEKIASILKASRVNAGFEAKEVAEKLIALGAISSVKSFYNWESGRTQPDADSFIFLCDLYGIKNIMTTFGYGNSSEKTNTISDKINRLDPADQAKAEAYIDGLLSQDKYNNEESTLA